MTQERDEYVARTAAGVVIQTFGTRAQAIAWAEDPRGAGQFSGWTLALETTITTVRRRVLRRDRLQRIA